MGCQNSYIMAKILVTTFTNMPGLVLDNFRQGLVEALAREGNDVMVLRSNDFLASYQDSNEVAESLNREMLLKQIRDFQPELVLSMNHSGIFERLSETMQCPIAIWLLDGPAYLVEPEECRRQHNRYHMLIPVRAFRDDLKDGFGFKDNHIHYLPFATDFQSAQCQFQQNISFVGTFFSNWRLQELVENRMEDRDLVRRIRQLIQSYEHDRDKLFSVRLREYGLSTVFTQDFDEAFILNSISINRRLKILDAVEELGISIFGNSEWTKSMPYSTKLALSYNPAQITTRQSLESLYNSSRINLNVSHAQARGGLPWRVFDVMACNGALVSDFQEDLSFLFGAELEIPIYDTPIEAHELCKKLLNDEVRRISLVESSQRAINGAHRFRHRIERLANILGLDLLPGGDGALRFLDADNFRFEDSAKALAKGARAEWPVQCETARFSLQLFQSHSLAFDKDNSQLAELSLPAPCKLHHEFTAESSLAFLRLDIGEYFSKHSKPELSVSLKDESESTIRTIIDFNSDVLASNQFHFNGSDLVCGFDAYCIFKNPFPGRNIIVAFDSMMELRT